MNDGYDGYEGQSQDRYELVGYDESGTPVYRLVPPAPPQPYQEYDPHAYGHSHGAYDQQPGYGQPAPPQQPYYQQPYEQQGYGYDPYAQDTGTQQPVPPAPDPYPAPPREEHRTQRPAADPYAELGELATRVDEPEARVPQQPRGGLGEREDGYRTEQFAFVEDPDEESEDVIDWLKFTESRTERREEAKRRGRARRTALICVLVLALVSGGGYLWWAGKLPGLTEGKDSRGTEAAGPQNRDMILVHLHNTKKGGTSTALMVDNTTTGRGTTVLLPNSLALAGDDGSATTLAKSVDEDGSSGTSEAVDTLLGTRIEGTWRLDTPYLNNLVELVGDIEVDTDADVPAEKAKRVEAPLVHKGEAQPLSGPMAVAYATHRAPGEPESAQLARFGQVMQGVLRKLSSDAQGATVTVQSLAQILDPSLPERELGAFLAKLAERAKGGDHRTQVLPVQRDGTLSREATDQVVKQVLGGKVKAPAGDETLRVGVRGGERTEADSARVSLLNGGYGYVDGGREAHSGPSEVRYADASRKPQATEVAKTLGLPAGSVREGEVPANADVLVVLGSDYEPPKSE